MRIGTPQKALGITAEHLSVGIDDHRRVAQASVPIFDITRNDVHARSAGQLPQTGDVLVRLHDVRRPKRRLGSNQICRVGTLGKNHELRCSVRGSADHALDGGQR